MNYGKDCLQPCVFTKGWFFFVHFFSTEYLHISVNSLHARTNITQNLSFFFAHLCLIDYAHIIRYIRTVYLSLCFKVRKKMSLLKCGRYVPMQGGCLPSFRRKSDTTRGLSALFPQEKRHDKGVVYSLSTGKTIRQGGCLPSFHRENDTTRGLSTLFPQGKRYNKGVVYPLSAGKATQQEGCLPIFREGKGQNDSICLLMPSSISEILFKYNL
jgi:hypothetical protein